MKNQISGDLLRPLPRTLRWPVQTEPVFKCDFRRKTAFVPQYRACAWGGQTPKTMKTKKRRTLSAGFKFRVALEALKGLRGINEIAAEYEVHPTQVSAWKKELKEGGSTLFERKNARDDERIKEKARTAELERTLGKVVVEKEFLIKKCGELGIEP